MDCLVRPHAGELMPLLVQDTQERNACVQEAQSLAKVRLSSREFSDLIMLATGAFSPLAGFMKEADYNSVVQDMRMASGVLWPMPVTLAVTKEQAKSLKEGQQIALVDPESDDIVADMVVEEKYSYDKTREAVNVFGTEDGNHPGVKKIFEQGDVYIGGPVRVFSEGKYPEEFPEYGRPADTRKIFAERGWTTVAAFQTRNPMHRSHEYLTKIAMEVCDGVLIHPIVGKLKTGDIPAKTRMECYKVLLENYYPEDRVLLKVYPMEMRYAGPREAVLHAIIRQNFGCSHLIVGRDHAGVGDYYGPFDAQNIFDELDTGSLHIKPLKLDWTFWCYKCGGMASLKTCPHDKKDRCIISGTQLRQMLSQGQNPSAEFSRPEVLEILKDYYNNKG